MLTRRRKQTGKIGQIAPCGQDYVIAWGGVFEGKLLLVLVLVTAAVGLIVGRPQPVGEMLATSPWQSLVGGGLLYGLLKGTIAALAR